ncbi:shufflon system plasmid conjugative transfer pilus tip adhesin PilV, partial [Salmonella enterica]|nr:shufflon system plasmid conjugative transfer pilus tip adhesin PilV [Salmonella enterica]
GAGGGWKMKLSDYGLSSKQGSLVTFIPSDQLGTSGQGNDRLYRYAVNGHPDSTVCILLSIWTEIT